MEPHSPRFSETPPGSPKSCMKGSRKLTFEKPSEGGGMASGTRGGESSPSPSPKKSPKSVSIRTHDDNNDFSNASTSSSSASPRVTSFDLPSASSTSAAGGSGSAPGPVQKKPPPAEIQFQFQLTEHFDQSTPPPNCTSNGNYDFEQPEGTESGSSTTQVSKDDPQLREIATKFVNDIIENAKVEAANRTKAEQNRAMIPGTSDRDTFSNGMGRGATPWYRRAHGLVSKWITNICVRAQNTLKADLK